MKLAAVLSTEVAILGVPSAEDSAVENFDNPAWWGKKKRDSTVENFDNPAWWGKDKMATTVENFDNPAWWGKSEEDR
ncbi:hypothetical protein MYCTH_2309513 [Thermothelomyces thermophilus ATCC 42464]|uniref:Uncharacterized protein n=1 Tax=Thermothelomyces thermophilus (strain ATCC 42464 / BCRC 31852 / DSM 1799) TaxID=573729 RepID=G2QIM3_THET4|nr:uncharacterized protein MYCTH_2309513 [Thermothelomyces thermophilus ATCC 42464]AEO60345.1 hypothetical protein MYCTH_2309513 [Thermothelomyces thermophilus ATCC 42464]